MIARHEEVVMHVEPDGAGRRIQGVDVAAERIGHVEEPCRIERDPVEATGRTCAGTDGIAARDRVAWGRELKNGSISEISNV